MAPEHPLRGYGLMLLAVVCFSAMDALAKSLTGRYTVGAILFVRYAAHALLLGVGFAPRLGSRLFRSPRLAWQMLRSCLLIAISWLFMKGLQHLPMAEATAILFLYPILLALASHLLLGERLSRAGWLAALGGFVGVLLIVRPEGGHFSRYVLFPLAAAFCQGCYLLLTRHFSGSDHPATTNFIAGAVGAGLCGLAEFSGASAPALPPLGAALGLGALALAGHYLLTVACRHVAPARLAPIGYGQLVVAGLIGYAVFGNLPDPIALTGMALICLSGAYLIHSQGRRSPGPD